MGIEWLKAIVLPMGALLLLSASTACDQIEKFTQQEKKNEREIAANKHFETHYANAEDAEWETKVDFYEVTFKVNGMKAKAHYDFTGKWLETQTDINVKHVPEIVCRRIEKMAQETKQEISIKSAEWIESPHTNFYNLTISTAEGEKKIKVDDFGSIIYQ